MLFRSIVEAVKAIENYEPTNNRSQLKKTGNNTLIIDAYNANPTSMGAALKNFDSLLYQNKVMILGDMLELGDDSLFEHKELINKALEIKPNQLFLVGGEFEKAYKCLDKQNDIIKLFPNSIELSKYLEENPQKGELILIKGSRGTRLERVIDKL